MHFRRRYHGLGRQGTDRRRHGDWGRQGIRLIENPDPNFSRRVQAATEQIIVCVILFSVLSMDRLLSSGYSSVTINFVRRAEPGRTC